MSQQIFAKIKEDSKYHCQQPMVDKQPVAFAVTLVPESGNGKYVVHGRPGQYRLADVNLFVYMDGRELMIA